MCISLTDVLKFKLVTFWHINEAQFYSYEHQNCSRYYSDKRKWNSVSHFPVKQNNISENNLKHGILDLFGSQFVWNWYVELIRGVYEELIITQNVSNLWKTLFDSGALKEQYLKFSFFVTYNWFCKGIRKIWFLLNLQLLLCKYTHKKVYVLRTAEVIKF